ncbi:MAG: cache domain-containing protein [Spirochaetales bacterium]|nr:cache domain-containing protein [Spirochaetales bacterium]
MNPIKNGKRGIRRKGILIALIFISLMTILTISYANLTGEQRLEHLQQTVLIARGAISPVINSYNKGTITKDEAITQVRDLVRNMVYTDSYGDNYIFMSNYQGIMLVQPFQPEMEMQDNWDLQDTRGKYIIRELIEAAGSEAGSGFVLYHYMRPNRMRPELKISYVIGIPELQCYIGTGQYMTDIRRSLYLYLSVVALISLALLSMILTMTRSTLKIYDIHSEQVTKENEELKTLQAALRRSEKNYKDLFEQSPIGLALCRMNGELVSVNPSYASIIGYSIEEVIKLSYWDITPKKYEEMENKMLQMLMETGKYGPYEKEYIHKNGHLVPVRLNGLMVERDGESYIWSSVEDTSVYKKIEEEKHGLEEQLRQAHKMEAVGTLAGGIAHDFNNLLVPILGYSEQLKSEAQKGSEAYNALEVILNSAFRARDLVRQILTFSRQDESRETIFSMQPEIENTLALLRSSLPSTIEIHQSLTQEALTIKGDPTQLHQIVMNIATNGYHAMEMTGGVLSVTLRVVEPAGKDFENQNSTSETYALLSIKDQGTGIDDAIMNKIFDPFFTTKEKGRGTGMGLSVVHGIIQSMGGFIKIQSQKGTGTECRIYFPASKGSVPSELLKQGEKEPESRNESILLVDDEKDVLTVEKLMLSRLGYNVTASTNPQEALDLFSSKPDSFDLIITDQTMPKMSGDRLISEIRKIRPAVPVILCSGNIAEAEAAIENDRNATSMNKPILMEDMTEAISRVLK